MLYNVTLLPHKTQGQPHKHILLHRSTYCSYVFFLNILSLKFSETVCTAGNKIQNEIPIFTLSDSSQVQTEQYFADVDQSLV